MKTINLVLLISAIIASPEAFAAGSSKAAAATCNINYFPKTDHRAAIATLSSEVPTGKARYKYSLQDVLKSMTADPTLALNFITPHGSPELQVFATDSTTGKSVSIPLSSIPMNQTGDTFCDGLHLKPTDGSKPYTGYQCAGLLTKSRTHQDIPDDQATKINVEVVAANFNPDDPTSKSYMDLFAEAKRLGCTNPQIARRDNKPEDASAVADATKGVPPEAMIQAPSRSCSLLDYPQHPDDVFLKIYDSTRSTFRSPTLTEAAPLFQNGKAAAFGIRVGVTINGEFVDVNWSNGQWKAVDPQKTLGSDFDPKMAKAHIVVTKDQSANLKSLSHDELGCPDPKQVVTNCNSPKFTEWDPAACLKSTTVAGGGAATSGATVLIHNTMSPGGNSAN